MTGVANFAVVKYSGYYGWLGVEIFFVISGFVIFVALSRVENFGGFRDVTRFFAKRLIRLEPPYLASITLTLALWYLSTLAPGFRGNEPEFAMLQLLFHFAYLIPFTHYDWLQPVYWTLSYEFFFYIFIALIFPFLFGRRRNFMYSILVGIFIVLALVGFLPPLALLFIMGSSTARLQLGRSSKLSTVIYVAITAIAMGLGRMYLEAAVGVAASALIAASGRIPAVSGRLRSVLLFLGTISYSLYLTHVPIGGRVVNLGKRFIETPVQEFAVACLALAISIIFATIFWWLIERPAVVAVSRFRVRPTAMSLKSERETG